MIIRKLFRFENAHIARDCLTKRCALSIHGHSYRVEVLLEANALDRAGMVMDFSRLKEIVGWFIDSFDHSIAINSHDESAYVEAMKAYSYRWVLLPVNPSAEQFARVILWVAIAAFGAAKAANGEGAIAVKSVIVHETETGYAEAYPADITNAQMGELLPSSFQFSVGVRADWGDPARFEKLFANDQ
ncbi:6-carboxytetrahydropterin synthase QueD [Campylobacterota bacterium]|nr:6-carboxytetrahydropterin synthase QueD [Campylobacterota bacterium]